MSASRRRRDRPRAVGSAVLLVAVAAAGGCRRAPEPVGRLEVTPSTFRLEFPEVRPLHLSWEPTERLPEEAGRPLVFVHLLDGSGRVLRTFDHPFPGDWVPGEPMEEDVPIYQSALAAPLAAGSYPLTVGLYRASGGERWPLEVAAPDRGRDEYAVATVEIPDAPSDAPRFDFAGDWGSVAAGSDSQVLAYRWLFGHGTIGVAGPPGRGRVELALDLPEAAAPATLLVLGDGAGTPTVTVTSTCGSEVTAVSGAGLHWVEVPVDPTQPDLEGGCEIALAPNFYLVSSGTPVRRAAELAVLAWSEGAGE
jgi:hypothetical protein